MVFNKTKRGLEKAAAIVSIVGCGINILVALFTFVLGVYYAKHSDITSSANLVTIYKKYVSDRSASSMIVSSIFNVALSAVCLVFSIKLIKSPVLPNGTLEKRKAFRICVLVFSVLLDNIVVVGLIIAVLCLKDFRAPKQPKPAKPAKVVAQPVATETPAQTKSAINNNNVAEYCADIEEIKKLKRLGVLDEESYKRALVKIISKIMKEN